MFLLARVPGGIAEVGHRIPEDFSEPHQGHILGSVMKGDAIVNVAAVKQLSPFRYPGGKTWLVPVVEEWLRSLKFPVETFIEPFAGGGIVGLTVAAERLAQKVILIELDHAVAAVWKTILGRDAQWLIDQILNFQITRDNVIARLARPARTRRELAFQTILRNRVQRGGILAPGASLMLNRENGRGVASRWYPRTLAERISRIRAMVDRIEFIERDAFQVMQHYLALRRAAWFIDPPYTAKGGKRAGTRLYTYNDVDHSRLFALAAGAAGAVMLTYDDADEVRKLAHAHGLRYRTVPMKNTHHQVLRELIITNDPVHLEPGNTVAAYIRNGIAAYQPTLF